jgi:RecA/RadA recombinase
LLNGAAHLSDTICVFRLPGGRIVEIFGPKSSGKTTLVYPEGFYYKVSASSATSG